MSETGTIQLHQAELLPINRIHRAPWNANVASGKTLDKIRRSLERYGSVENSVVRPMWCVGARSQADVRLRRESQMDGGGDDTYETLSGNHRLDIYRDAGLVQVPCAVVELSDAEARMLAQTLNRTRGQDDPDKLKALLKDIVADIPVVDVSTILPQSERDLASILNTFPESGTGAGSSEETIEPPKNPVSKLGEVYELGPHRLICGDATDPEVIARLLDGAEPALMITDPPYGVNLDLTWRDHTSLQRVGAAEAGVVENDDRASWHEAYALVPSCEVAYVWHASTFCGTVQDDLEKCGFAVRQQIIWVKPVHVIGRSAYHWRHEACWYAVRKGKTASWLGGRKQNTVWDMVSPKTIYGQPNDEERLPHPTQKPLEAHERPMRNHEGDAFDPFAGSGTTLIAAARLDRKAFCVELNPAYVDVIRMRWGKYAKDAGIEPGPHAL